MACGLGIHWIFLSSFDEGAGSNEDQDVEVCAGMRTKVLKLSAGFPLDFSNSVERALDWSVQLFAGASDLDVSGANEVGNYADGDAEFLVELAA